MKIANFGAAVKKEKLTPAEAFDRLGKAIVTLQSQQDLFLEQLSELNLRVRFTMETFKCTRTLPVPTIATSEDDLKPQTVTATLYELYMGGEREKYIKKLQEIEDAWQDLRTAANGKGQGQATPAGDDGSASGITIENAASTSDVAGKSH